MYRKFTKKMVTFVSVLVLAVSIIIGIMPSQKAEAASAYSVNAALSYAQSHWNDGQGLCAEFVSRCVKAGGINMSVQTGTYECYKAICNATGLSGQDLKLNAGGYATYGNNSSILAAGDVVIQWCYTCNLRPHILICGGYNSKGEATFYAHNAALNNGTYRLNANKLHKSTCNIGAKVIHLSALDKSSTSTPANNPTGCVDAITGGLGEVSVRGWAFDKDSIGTSLEIHVYIGGSSGTSGAEGHRIKADQWRSDVNDVYGVGNYHGYSKAIQTNKRGNQAVYIYAINVGGGQNVELGHAIVNIQDIEKNPPVISNVQIIRINSNGYTVAAQITDDSGIDRVQFPTWTAANGQDDLIKDWGTNSACSGQLMDSTAYKGGDMAYEYDSNGKMQLVASPAIFDVKISDHNNERGIYETHIYAYDIYGNVSSYRLPLQTVPEPAEEVPKPVKTEPPASTVVPKPVKTNPPVSTEIPKPANTNPPVNTEKPASNSSTSLYGDVDFNGKVTLGDAQRVLKAALRIINLSEKEIKIADINKNGMIQLSDAQRVLKMALRIEKTIPMP